MPSPAQTQRTHRIRILKLSRRKAGTIRALVDVQVGRLLKIFGAKVVQQPGQKAWVAMPSKEWLGDDGRKRYTAVVELDGALKVAVESAILEAWQGGAR
jgi:DNA-binding cell septation regulator SpoVG